MDGHAVARAIRHEPPGASVRLIAATGYGRPEDQRRSREAGFDFHLTKPIDLDHLLSLVAAPCTEEKANPVGSVERAG
jgi:CheY-like chemotaxis protein